MQRFIAGTAVPRATWEMDEAHGTALARRGLDVETAVRLGWRPCVGPTDQLWISIPIIDQGKVIGRKYRTLAGEKRFTQDKGTPQILYNIDCLRDPQLAGYPLVITEGEIDTLAAIQAGYPRTVSVPGGAPQTDNGGSWRYLEQAHELIDKIKPIVLAVDNDAPGRVLQEGLARRLGRSRCQAVTYPDGKDLGDVLMARGVRAVRHTLATAEYLPLPGLERLHQIPERKPARALDTMIPDLATHWRIRRGDLIVITGPPGHGKSSFVANVICNMAWHWRATAVVASFEQQIVPDLRRTLRTYRAECLEKFMSAEQIATADAWINEHFIFVRNPTETEDPMTLDWLLERFAAAATRHGASICVIDPWNEVSIADKPTDWTTEQWVSQSLRAIKAFARTHDVAMVVVAHPAKMRRDRNGKIPRPGLWDIADSAAWANRADVGIIIHRPDNALLTEITVEKSRDYYAIGTPGMISLKWEPETSRFIKPR